MSTTPSTPAHSWIPLFDPDERSGHGIEQIIDAAAQACVTASASDVVTDHTLSQGLAGIAIFFSYLAKACDEAAWLERADGLLTRAVREARLAAPAVPLYQGTTGLAWALSHLGLHEHPLYRAFLDEFDEFLLTAVRTTPWRGHFDLINGLAGIGVYALSRPSDSRGPALVSTVVERLSETALPMGNGVLWWTAPQFVPEADQQSFPRGFFDLGLAHGLPGVMNLLARVSVSANTDTRTADAARRLAEQAALGLLSRRNPAGAGCAFHTKLDLFSRDVPSGVSPIGWCYGDLGVAAALYAAGVLLEQQVWRSQAHEIARHTASRSLDKTVMKDPGLCHGAAGNGHILNRLYQALRDPLLADAARHWFDLTVGLYEPGVGVGGFRAWYGRTASGDDWWMNLAGLLRGTAGIALALVSAIEPLRPDWDEMLLVSIPAKTADPRPDVSAHAMSPPTPDAPP